MGQDVHSGRSRRHPTAPLARASLVAALAAVAMLVAGTSGGAQVTEQTATVTVRVRDALVPNTVGANTWGRVTSVPAGIDCPGDCTADFARGSKVLMRVRPRDGFTLTQWRVGTDTTCDKREACSVRVRGDMLVKAELEPAARLNAVVEGAGSLDFDPAERSQRGRACTNRLTFRVRACLERYVPGTRVTVRARPDRSTPDARFAGWSHPDCPGLERSCTITPQPGDVDLYATFSPVYLTITKSSVPIAIDPPSPPCRFARDPRDPNRRLTCTLAFSLGKVVRLTRPATRPGDLRRWLGDCQRVSARVCDLRMVEDRFVAVGEPLVPPNGNNNRTIRLEYHGTPGGRITIASSAPRGQSASCTRTCTQVFEQGERVEIRAEAGGRAKFERWLDIVSRSSMRMYRIGTSAQPDTIPASFVPK
jgi:hypothetical protein